MTSVALQIVKLLREHAAASCPSSKKTADPAGAGSSLGNNVTPVLREAIQLIRRQVAHPNTLTEALDPKLLCTSCQVRGARSLVQVSCAHDYTGFSLLALLETGVTAAHLNSTRALLDAILAGEFIWENDFPVVLVDHHAVNVNVNAVRLLLRVPGLNVRVSRIAYWTNNRALNAYEILELTLRTRGQGVHPSFVRALTLLQAHDTLLKGVGGVKLGTRTHAVSLRFRRLCATKDLKGVALFSVPDLCDIIARYVFSLDTAVQGPPVSHDAITLCQTQWIGGKITPRGERMVSLIGEWNISFPANHAIPREDQQYLEIHTLRRPEKDLGLIEKVHPYLDKHRFKNYGVFSTKWTAAHHTRGGFPRVFFKFRRKHPDQTFPLRVELTPRESGVLDMSVGGRSPACDVYVAFTCKREPLHFDGPGEWLYNAETQQFTWFCSFIGAGTPVWARVTHSTTDASHSWMQPCPITVSALLPQLECQLRPVKITMGGNSAVEVPFNVERVDGICGFESMVPAFGALLPVPASTWETKGCVET